MDIISCRNLLIYLDAETQAKLIPLFNFALNSGVCRGTFGGKETLGIRLNWEKRYITLGPVATIIGLAFRLHDPDHLLGDKEDIGITCALVPAKLPGITIGTRHDPLGIPFQNGPTWGKDVFF